MRSVQLYKIDPIAPAPELIAAAVRVLKNGGAVVFPTHSLYGLGVDAGNAKAVLKAFAIKQRSLQKPLLVLVKNRNQVYGLAAHVPAAAACLMDHFWPGGLTVVLPAKASVPQALTGGSGGIGIRVPAHPVAAALVAAAGGPVTGTSANLSGAAGGSRISELDPGVLQRVDLVLDAGPLTPGTGSTVVDVSDRGVRILREGTVSKEKILLVLKDHGFKMIDNPG